MISVHFTDAEIRLVERAAKTAAPDWSRSGRPGPTPGPSTRFILWALGQVRAGRLDPLAVEAPAGVSVGPRSALINFRYDLGVIDRLRGPLARSAYVRLVVLAAAVLALKV